MGLSLTGVEHITVRLGTVIYAASLTEFDDLGCLQLMYT